MRAPKFLAFLTDVLGFTPTPAQRVFEAVAYDDTDPIDLPSDDRELARLMFGPVERVSPIARDVLDKVKGARVGGTYEGACYLLYRAIYADLSTLAPGEQATALVVGPDMRLARQSLRYARGAAASVPDFEDAIVADKEDSFAIVRPDGTRVAIEALPATRGGSALRGRSLVAVQLTESAFFRAEDSGTVNDADIFKAVLPRIMPGGKVLFESTPWLESGLTYELFRDNFGNPTTALAAHCPTLLMRPDARTAALVAKERLRDPDNAAVEFDAQFMGGGAGTFFDPASNERAVDDERPVIVRAPVGAMLGFGGDVGLVSDSSALAAVAAIGDRFELLEIIELRPARGAPLKLSDVIATFASTMKAHGKDERTFYADGHAREPAREFANKHGVVIEAAPEGNSGKWETYSLLQKLLKEGRFTMPRHPRLMAQLAAVVSRPMPGGGFRITSPRRAGAGHGDLVSAVVLATYAAANRPVPIHRPDWLDDPFRPHPNHYRLGNSRGF